MAATGERGPTNGPAPRPPVDWFASLSGVSQVKLATVIVTTVGTVIVAVIGVASRPVGPVDTPQRAATAEVNVTVNVPEPPSRVAAAERTPEPTPSTIRAGTFHPELVLSYPEGSPCATTVQVGPILARDQWPSGIEQGAVDVNRPIIPANIHLGATLRSHPKLTPADLTSIHDEYFDLLGITWDRSQAVPCLDLLGLTPMIASRFGGDPNSSTIEVPVACIARPPGTSRSYWVTTNREQIGSIISADGSTHRFKDFEHQSYLLERSPQAPYGWVVVGWIPRPIPGCIVGSNPVGHWTPGGKFPEVPTGSPVELIGDTPLGRWETQAANPV